MKVFQDSDYTFVSKGWGWEKWLVNNEKYCGKILHFYAGKRLSWHKHLEKDEFFWVMSGKVLMKYSWGDDLEKAEEVVLSQGEGFHIPTGLRHQVFGIEESDVIEFSTTHRDEDSIRIVRGD